MSNNQLYSIVVPGLICPCCGNSFRYDMDDATMTCCGGEDCILSGKHFVVPQLPLVEVPEVNEWHKCHIVDKES